MAAIKVFFVARGRSQGGITELMIHVLICMYVGAGVRRSARNQLEGAAGTSLATRCLARPGVVLIDSAA